MTIYTKPAVLPAWAEDKVGVPADMLQPVDADIKIGWPLSAIPPSRQRFNWLLNYASNAVRYFMQRGLPQYDAAEDYPLNARIQDAAGNEFRCIQAGIGHTPATSPTWWKPVRDSVPAVTAGGSANAITADFTPDIAAPLDGEVFLVQFIAANTGAATINVDGGGAVALVKNGDLPLVPYDIPGADAWGLIVRDSSLGKYVLLNPATGVNRILTPGCGYLSKSGANLFFGPRRGNDIPINGKMEKIPAAGITLVPTGTAADSNYNIFVYMNAGVMTLERSATGHSTDATTGVEIMTGDPTRTYVGKARTVLAGAWVDDVNHIYVISWFNPRRKVGAAAFTAGRSVASGTPGFNEVNAEIRVYWLTHGIEAPEVTFTGGIFVTGAATGAGFADLNGVTVGSSFFYHNSTSTNSMSVIDNNFVAAEGNHYTTLFANCNGGVLLGFIGGANGQVAQQVVVMG